MPTVHVFSSTGRFRLFAEMRAFIDKTYTQDGDAVPSPFIREVQLSNYEPGCIEAVNSERVIPLTELLHGASYSDQWLPQLDGSRRADAAICVFEPNVVGRPEGSSLEYCGAFEYQVVHPEWFQRLLRGDRD